MRYEVTGAVVPHDHVEYQDFGSLMRLHETVVNPVKYKKKKNKK
jgi:hypothetical protein